MNTIVLLEQARKTGLKKIIFLSSDGTVYGLPRYLPISESNPTDPICSYSIAKLAIEKYLELYRMLHGIDCHILRVSNPHGEGQRLISTQGAVAVLMGRIINHEKIDVWGDGSIVRDYINIADVISALVSVMDYSGRGHLFNIGAGVPVTRVELISALEFIAGKKAKLEFMPSCPLDAPHKCIGYNKSKTRVMLDSQN